MQALQNKYRCYQLPDPFVRVLSFLKNAHFQGKMTHFGHFNECVAFRKSKDLQRFLWLESTEREECVLQDLLSAADKRVDLCQ